VGGGGKAGQTTFVGAGPRARCKGGGKKKPEIIYCENRKRNVGFRIEKKKGGASVERFQKASRKNVDARGGHFGEESQCRHVI